MRISFNKNTSEVLSGIQNGDSNVMEKVYNENRNEFVNWSIKKFGISEEDALDHYQDVITLFYEKVMNGSVEEINSSIKTYLFGIGKNKVRQQFDKQSRHEKHEEGLAEHYLFLAKDVQLNKVFEESKNGVAKVFDTIGEACKKILQLFYFDKKPMNEIAKVLGHKSEGVSRTTKKRCLEKIRSQLKSFDHE